MARILRSSIWFVGFMILTGCNDNSAIKGFWIEPKGTAVVKIDAQDFNLHVLAMDKTLTFPYELVEDGAYVLVNGDMSAPTALELNEDNTVLTMFEKNLPLTKVKYVRPANIEEKQLHGAWLINFDSADADEVVFEKHIIIFKPGMKFDFYGINVDEQRKIMNITTSKNKSLLLDEGFMIGYQDRSGNKNYGHYILNIEPDEVKTVYKTGRKAVFKRINFEGHFDVPEGYKIKTHESDY